MAEISREDLYSSIKTIDNLLSAGGLDDETKKSFYLTRARFEEELLIGGDVTINGSGDLKMDSYWRQFADDDRFTVVRKTKKGLFILKDKDGKELNPIPKKNIDLVVYMDAYIQFWDESERGWGFRSDGCSLHFTKEDAEAYVKRYEDSLPKEVPHEYEICNGKPIKCYIVNVLYDKIHGIGKRIWQTELNKLLTVKDIKIPSK